MFKFGSDVGAAGANAFDGLMTAWGSMLSHASEHATRTMTDAMAAVEATRAAPTIEDATAAQAEFLRKAWQNSVTAASAMTGLAADMTRDVVGPIERELQRRR